MLHFTLLALAIFLIYEVARAGLPTRTPGVVHALLLPAIAYLLDRYVDERILMALAAASVAAILDRIVTSGSNVLRK
jgi:hypothetical protein